MPSKLVFMRRTPKEIEIFGGQVFIDINNKNVGILDTKDLIIELAEGSYKIKMAKSHTYGTFIGLVETEIEVKEKNDLVIQYSAPMLVNQPGNMVISDYTSMQDVDSLSINKEISILKDVQREQKKKLDLENKSKKGILIFIAIIVVSYIFYAMMMSMIYARF